MQLGADVSYPQCSEALPPLGAFAVVGVNDGRPFVANPCLGPGMGASELLWAGIGAQLYANTADPGPALSSHWPNGQATPQQCNTPAASGADTTTCAYDYGWNAAEDSYRNAVDAYIGLGWAASGATRTPVANSWWLDVESANSWEANVQTNVAELRGEIDYLKSVGAASVGIYSPTSNWQTITAGTNAFAGMPTWVPGASSETEAQARCASPGVSGGPTLLVQFSSPGGMADLSCAALPALAFSAKSPSAVNRGTPSAPIVVVLPQAATMPTLVSFTSSSPSGNFSTAASGPWSPSLLLTVAAGATRTRAVFYKDGAPGAAVVAASAAGDANATRSISLGKRSTCTSANADHGFELALARARTPAAAAGLLRRAAAALRHSRRHAGIERDGCSDFELAVSGFPTRKAAAQALPTLRPHFRAAAIETT